MGGLKSVFFEEKLDPEAAVDEIIAYATKARKSSIVSLEEDLEKAGDKFLRKRSPWPSTAPIFRNCAR